MPEKSPFASVLEVQCKGLEDEEAVTAGVVQRLLHS